jgi:hypothetical protein
MSEGRPSRLQTALAFACVVGLTLMSLVLGMVGAFNIDNFALGAGIALILAIGACVLFSKSGRRVWAIASALVGIYWLYVVALLIWGLAIKKSALVGSTPQSAKGATSY